MSEKSIVKDIRSTDILSVNGSFSLSTHEEEHVWEFMNDVRELFNEWNSRVQVTSCTVSLHDHRKYDEIFELVGEEDKD